VAAFAKATDHDTKAHLEGFPLLAATETVHPAVSKRRLD
jgi:hypothetical protein